MRQNCVSPVGPVKTAGIGVNSAMIDKTAFRLGSADREAQLKAHESGSQVTDS